MTGSALDQIGALDAAWNTRDWAAYAALLSPDLAVHDGADPTPHGKPEHVSRAEQFCRRFPDSRVGPYLVAATGDDCSCTVATLTGGPAPALLAVVCRWADGRLVQQYQLVSTPTAKETTS